MPSRRRCAWSPFDEVEINPKDEYWVDPDKLE